MQPIAQFCDPRVINHGKRYKLLIAKDGLETYLTLKEAVIVSLLVRGFRAKQIAWELKSSLHTINTHLSNIKEKLQCSNIFQLGLILGKYKQQLEIICHATLPTKQ